MLMFFTLNSAVSWQSLAQNNIVEYNALDYKKALLIGKFVKYIGWPTTQDNRTKFNIGVYDDHQFYDFLNNFFIDKTVNGKDITITLVNSVATARQVDLLYFSSEQRNKIPKIAKRINGSNILIVSENSKDLLTTMINLSINKENSNITVKINHDNLINEKLTVPNSSFFLDGNNNGEVFSLRQSAIDRNAIIESLQQEVFQKNEQIINLNNTLKLAEQKSTTNDIRLQKQLEEVKLLTTSNTKQEQQLKSSEQKSAQLTEQLKEKSQQLQMNKNEWLLAEDDKTQQLEDEIKHQKTQVNTLEDALTKQEAVVSQQKKQLLIMQKEGQQSSMIYIVLLIAVAAIVALIYLWLRLKNATGQGSDISNTLTVREQQLVKAESVIVFGYLATDITYSAAHSLEELIEYCKIKKDDKCIEVLTPIVTILNNLNNIAADQDEINKESFDVVTYINKVISLFVDDLEQSNINYSYHGESNLLINSIPSQIALVLINLVNNSIRHGFNNKGNGKISITIEKAEQGRAKIVYQDDGAGMDNVTQQQVFSPFFTTKSERGYLGLGLSIARDLVENKLAGKIKLESQLGKGTTITITL